MALWDLQASAGTTGQSILWRGAWSSALSYNPYDAVYSSSSGSSYISKTNNANKDPVGNPSDWDLLASVGGVGPREHWAGCRWERWLTMEESPSRKAGSGVLGR